MHPTKTPFVVMSADVGCVLIEEMAAQCLIPADLSDKAQKIKPTKGADTYKRRLYDCLHLPNYRMSADVADILCLALGIFYEHRVETYAGNAKGAEERVKCQGNTPKYHLNETEAAMKSRENQLPPVQRYPRLQWTGTVRS